MAFMLPCVPVMVPSTLFTQTFSLGSNFTIPSKYLLINRPISAPLPESKYNLVPVFTSGSKLTHSQRSFLIQPTEWKQLLGSYSATDLSCFLPVSHYQIFPFALVPSYSFWQYVLFICIIASKDFGIACSFNCYRVYLSFPPISDMTSTTYMAYFATQITLTQYEVWL